MAEPRLTLVDRVFDQLPEPTNDAEAKQRKNIKAVVAKYIPSAIKLARPAILEEGRLDALRKLGVQRIEEASLITDLKAQHAESMQHLKEQYGRGSLYKGLVIGVAFSVFTGTMGLLGGYALFERGVTTQVAAERVPRAVPTLQYEAPTLAYEHDRREPGDAP